jgi:hypothetical protein
MNLRAQDLGISPELLLDVFDTPITFHRCLIPVSGGVNAALLLSHAIWTTQGLDGEADGWFLKSQEQWAEETGLSRWEQETARRALRDAGLLEERRVGMPARLWFRVKASSVWAALKAQAARSAR